MQENEGVIGTSVFSGASYGLFEIELKGRSYGVVVSLGSKSPKKVSAKVL
jgi:hypothetical protein